MSSNERRRLAIWFGAIMSLTGCDAAHDIIEVADPTGSAPASALSTTTDIQQGFKTWFELRCQPGHTGRGTFSVTRNGTVIGTLTLNCTSGMAVAGMVVTANRPNDWEMILRVTRVSDGRRRTCEYRGTEFPATRRCFPSPMGITASVTVPRVLP